MTNIDRFASTVAQGIAARIREVRETQGMSQQAVADALTARGYEFSRPMVTKTESAGRPITVADLAAFAVVFGVAVTDFFTKPDDAELKALNNEWLAYESQDVVLAELQEKITAERAAIAKRTAQLNARRAALGG